VTSERSAESPPGRYTEYRKANPGELFRRSQQQLDRILDGKAGKITLARSPEDILEAKKKGSACAVLAIEGSDRPNLSVLVPGGTSMFREFSKRRNDYFFNPRRRRSSLEEIAPSFFVRDRERSMIARNLRFVLRDTVSSSAFRIDTTAAKGLPFFTTINRVFSGLLGVL
jgi:hypothetical protein